MENLDINNSMWQLQAMFHQSWIQRIKQETGATNVVHIKDQIRDGEKVNCIRIKMGGKEIMYGGKTDFSLFTPEDYKAAIQEFNSL